MVISVQTKIISTADENQKNQATLHPALDVFTKIFAGLMQQQQPATTPITGFLIKEILMSLFSNDLWKFLPRIEKSRVSLSTK